MFDLNGNVIGINSALISPTGASVGIGLAIPAELAKPVIDALMQGPAPVARLSRRRPPAGRRGSRARARPAQGQRRDRPLGRRRRAAARGRAAAGRRHRQGQRPGGHPRQTVSYLVANTHGRLAHPARDHPRRQARDGHGRRSASARPRKRSGRSAAATTRRAPTRRRRRRSAKGARPVAGAADARARRARRTCRDRARRDHHRGRPEQRCRRAGPPARRPHRLGQQPGGDLSGAGHRRRRRGAQGGPLERPAAGQARQLARSLRRRRHRRQLAAERGLRALTRSGGGGSDSAKRSRTASAPSGSAW